MAERKHDPSHVDHEHLQVTGKHTSIPAPNVDIHGEGADVLIVLTRAFGPRGDNLIGISDVSFDGYPALTVGVRGGGKEGLVHLSPIHGDARKSGLAGIAPGTKCVLYCPVSGELLPKVGEVDDGSGAEYCALYLTPERSESAMVMLSDVWGHYHSRVVDDFELISYWAHTHDDG
jgi:hypothetical protein